MTLTLFYYSLSYHFRQVPGCRNLALRYTTKAADYAISKCAYSTALSCIETSLPLLQDPIECDLLIQVVIAAIADLRESLTHLYPTQVHLLVTEKEYFISSYAALNEKLQRTQLTLLDSRISSDDWGVSEATPLDVTPVLTNKIDSFVIDENYSDRSLDGFGRGTSKSTITSFYGFLNTELSYSSRRSKESYMNTLSAEIIAPSGSCRCTIS